jgi:hypothetical protein
MLTPHRTFPRVAATAVLLLLMAPPIAAQGAELLQQASQPDALSLYEEFGNALIRLPLAALLGTALALRPRRPGTPERSMPVIETQIVLAIVGALIMLVIGASLARAFGIVGAANLIRYRAKIDDPKDAVVMLSTLSVGLASGVGLYALAGFGTLFIGLALWAIESFERESRKPFELSITLKGHARDIRPKVEEVLRRHHVAYELRGSSDDEITYWTTAPKDVRLDRVSNALTRLRKEEDLAVEWDEKKPKNPA